MLVKRYYKQKAILRKATGEYNPSGQPIYTDKSINCRLESNYKLVLDKTGREVVSETLMFCDEKISLSDLVVYQNKTMQVLAVSEEVSLNGEFSHIEVRL